MTLDIAMGGSTNTVLHLLAVAQEAKVDFTMKDIDRLSRHVPHLCKVAPSTAIYHMEDVHRAGGVMAILGQLDKLGLVNQNTKTCLGMTMEEQLEKYDIEEPIQVGDLISYFPQSRPVPDMQALDVVLMGRYPYMHGKFLIPEQERLFCLKMMQKMEIAHFAERNMQTLSFGERQKVYLVIR